MEQIAHTPGHIQCPACDKLRDSIIAQAQAARAKCLAYLKRRLRITAIS